MVKFIKICTSKWPLGNPGALPVSDLPLWMSVFAQRYLRNAPPRPRSCWIAKINRHLGCRHLLISNPSLPDCSAASWKRREQEGQSYSRGGPSANGMLCQDWSQSKASRAWVGVSAPLGVAQKRSGSTATARPGVDSFIRSATHRTSNMEVSFDPKHERPPGAARGGEVEPPSQPSQRRNADGKLGRRTLADSSAAPGGRRLHWVVLPANRPRSSDQGEH